MRFFALLACLGCQTPPDYLPIEWGLQHKDKFINVYEGYGASRLQNSLDYTWGCAWGLQDILETVDQSFDEFHGEVTCSYKAVF